MLFSLGQHAALEAIKRRLRDDEKLFAFLDDLTVVCHPDRVRDVMNIIYQELQAHAHISIHHGKTQVWNRGGVEPEGVEKLTRRARLVKPDAVVWKGDHTFHPQQQGIRVLGAPLGSAEYVQSHLEQKSVEQETLFHRIPQDKDTQASWLCDKQRHPEVAEIMLTGIDWNHHEVAPCFQAVRDCADTLREAGLVMPTWRVLADTPPTRDLQAEPAESKFGWQHRAASCLEEQFPTTLWPTFTDAQKALLRSQRGLLASAALTVSPTSRATRIEPQPFRLWLCRRLFLPLPMSSRTCRCGRRLDI